jgi:hypothetical protein
MTNFIYRISCTLVLSITAIYATGQSLAINTDGSTANTSALLDVKSTNKGLLIPRMSKVEKNAIAAPATGLLIFQNAPDSLGFYYYNGSGWLWLSSVVADTIAWKTAGNNGLPDTSFIGHRDLKPLNFRLNNLRYGRIHPTNSAISFGRQAGNISNTTGHIAIGDSAATGITSATPGVFIGYRAGKSVTTGSNNVFIGNLSGTNNTTGGQNSFYGSQAGTNNTTGFHNVFLGYLSGSSNRQSGLNTAVGSFSLSNHEGTSSSYNTAIGYAALADDSTGIYNTAVGAFSFQNNYTSQHNTGIGSYTGRFQTGENNFFGGTFAGYGERGPFTNYAADSGSYNTALGGRAMYSLANGNYNTAVGHSSLFYDSSGAFNTAIGAEASLYGDTSGFVTSVGYRSLSFNQRSGNTGLGAFSGYNNSRSTSDPLRGTENTIVGYAAMYGNAWGSKNAVLGYKAMGMVAPEINGYITAVPSRNVAIGDSALYNNRGNDNIGIGYLAAATQNNFASENVVVGSKALFSNLTGSGKVAIGYEALYSDTLSTTDLQLNTAVGYKAIRNSRFSEFNTAVGAYSLLNAGSTGTATTPTFNGGYNTAVGYSALVSTTTGYSNTAIGVSAGNSNTTGIGNVVIGTLAGIGSTSLASVSIGYFATVGNGINNTALGSSANVNANLTNATAIGANATVAQSNSLVLGSSANVGIGVNTPNTKLHIDGGTDADIANATSGYLLMGDATGANMIMDQNEIIARNNGAAATLYLQYQSGNVVIGANTAGSHKLSVNGDAAKAGGGTWAVYSDSRLKKNVVPYSDGLSSLLKINPVSFNYNDVTGYDTQKTYIGVIAQELQQVSPYMVSPLSIRANDGTPYLQVDNSAMIYMLINSVKEQQTQMTETKKQIETLNNIVLQQQQIINRLQKQ